MEGWGPRASFLKIVVFKSELVYCNCSVLYHHTQIISIILAITFYYVKSNAKNQSIYQYPKKLKPQQSSFLHNNGEGGSGHVLTVPLHVDDSLAWLTDIVADIKNVVPCMLDIHLFCRYISTKDADL